MSEAQLNKIGIFEPENAGWMAGPQYIRMLCHSLTYACRAQNIDVYLFRYRQTEEPTLPVKIEHLQRRHYRWGEAYIRRVAGLGGKSPLLAAAKKHKISVLLPLQGSGLKARNVKTIGWISDFQHVVLPEMFSPGELSYRDSAFRSLAKRSTLIMLSSGNALEHFAAFAPEHANKGRVVTFPSLFAYEYSNEPVGNTSRKYNVPEKFVLVANQFWRHKNHRVVIDALSLLRRKGIFVHVVMTGLPVDFRDPNNQTLSHILQTIGSAGLHDQVRVLGMLPLHEFRDLIRTAALVIQPSQFEGWSSTVQDCKALGRPFFCSDIPVHREQAPDALGLFPCHSAETLADLLAAHWPLLEPGPDYERELKALAAERALAHSHGERLLALCHEAAAH